MDSTAIKEAVNTSWTLHKTKIFLQQADDFADEANDVWTNVAARDHILKSIFRNTERVKTADAQLQLLHEELSELFSSEGKKEKETKMEGAMTELKRTLQKALNRKSEQLRQEKMAREHHEAVVESVVDAPVLCDKEMDDFVKVDQFSLVCQLQSDPKAD